MRSLRSQLLLSHVLLVALMASAMVVGVVEFVYLGREVRSLLKNNFVTALDAQAVEVALREQELGFNVLIQERVGDGELILEASTRRLDVLIPRLVDVTAQEPADAKTSADLATKWAQYRSFTADLRSKNGIFSVAPGLAGVVKERISTDVAAMIDDARTLRLANVREVEEDQTEIGITAAVALRRNLGVSLIATALAVLLALRLVRMSLTPLALIARHAEKIGEGDDVGDLQIPRRDEVGALAESVNTMAAKLADARRSENRKLERAQRMSDAALDSLYDPVVVTDARQRILFLNRAAENLFGTIPEGIRPPIAERITDNRIRRAIDDAVARDRLTAAEDDTSLATIAGRTYRIRATPMRSEDNDKLLGSVLVLEDVTHLKVLDRLKTEFIGVASHELRTPVTSLLLATQLLQEEALGPLTENQKQIVGAQKQDLERLERLMRDLLDVTRLEAGSLPPRIDAVRPIDVLSGPIHTLRPQAEGAGLTFEVDVPEDLPPVRADRQQIGRVVTNLVANAIRHTPAGGRVSVIASAADGGVRFEIRDTGEGIPEAYLAKIFGRFVQVPGATGGGAGLGLSIAQNIVRAHGAELVVQSTVGTGSAFSFTLESAARAA